MGTPVRSRFRTVPLMVNRKAVVKAAIVRFMCPFFVLSGLRMARARMTPSSGVMSPAMIQSAKYFWVVGKRTREAMAISASTIPLRLHSNQNVSMSWSGCF